MPKAPKLSNDCFALPQGVDWTPVPDALDSLRVRLPTVAQAETIPISEARGRILAAQIRAKRSNPPFANSAVDGFGFAHSCLDNVENEGLPLDDNRAAAGNAPNSAVLPGRAIRILTGAQVPKGVDTVVLEEDVALEDGRVYFQSSIRKGANIRPMAEDVEINAPILEAAHLLRAPDLALLAAAGIESVPVFEPLKVGVLSTGDELVDIGSTIADHQIYDANRPMLLSLIQGWNMTAIDLGHINDASAAVENALNHAATTCDVIITSGGASAGDEDHISRTLKTKGQLDLWRIAVKPGRPLALGIWKGTPVFGLPGNPVAAFVCTLIFARPALMALSGAGWITPRSQLRPAAFTKTKKQGRHEYLRARLNSDGAVETYASEGSGRVSGLSWAEGLVMLDAAAREIKPGDMVAYIPYTEFGV